MGPSFSSSIQGFERFPSARLLLEEGLREGVFPGAVAGVWDARSSTGFEFAWGGSRRLRLKGVSELPMERDTIFDLASVSKVFATSALAMALIERGWIRWDSPVRDFLPEYRNEGTTLRHLAAHVSGLPAWVPLYERMRAAFHYDDLESIAIQDRQRVMRALACEVDLERSVGTKAVYSDIGFMVLGFCLEEAARMPLDLAVERFVWRPMGLIGRSFPGLERQQGPFFVHTNQAAFRARNERVAATEDCPWRKAILQGQVHDDNAWAMGGYGGHAGAFGTALDLLRFGKGLLTGHFSKATMAEAWSRFEGIDGCERTPGWDTPSGNESAFGPPFSARSVGHLGFTGTSLWLDPDRGIVVTLLTNRVHPSRENTLIRRFRARFHHALANDLGLN